MDPPTYNESIVNDPTPKHVSIDVSTKPAFDRTSTVVSEPSRGGGRLESQQSLSKLSDSDLVYHEHPLVSSFHRSATSVFEAMNRSDSAISLHSLIRQGTPLASVLWPIPGLSRQGTLEEITCPICFCDCPKSQTHTVQGCQHTMCKSCLVRWFTACVGQGQYILCCPHVDDTPCNMPLDRHELEAILPGDILEKMDRFEKLSQKNKRECPFCGTVQVGDPEMPMLTCMNCNREHCFVHSAAHDSSLTCEEYEKNHHEEFHQNLQAAFADKAQPCPGCEAIVSKTEGCNHMTCSNCEAEFCYKCGVDIKGMVGEHYNIGACNQFDVDPYADVIGFQMPRGSCTSRCLTWITIIYVGLLFIPLYICTGVIALPIFVFFMVWYGNYPPTVLHFFSTWYMGAQVFLIILLGLGIALPFFICGLILGLCLLCTGCIDDAIEFALGFSGGMCMLIFFSYLAPLFLFLCMFNIIGRFFCEDQMPSDLEDMFEPAAQVFVPDLDDS